MHRGTWLRVCFFDGVFARGGGSGGDSVCPPVRSGDSAKITTSHYTAVSKQGKKGSEGLVLACAKVQENAFF